MSNYLRRERRAWGLTQPELARLIGCRCATQLSRIERNRRHPSLHIVIASKILFGRPLYKIFPCLYDEIEEAVMRQAYRLYQKLESDRSPRAMRKKELLDRVLCRAVKRTNPNQFYAKKDQS